MGGRIKVSGDVNQNKCGIYTRSIGGLTLPETIEGPLKLRSDMFTQLRVPPILLDVHGEKPIHLTVIGLHKGDAWTAQPNSTTLECVDNLKVLLGQLCSCDET
jgi:hypothetical protein